MEPVRKGVEKTHYLPTFSEKKFSALRGTFLCLIGDLVKGHLENCSVKACTTPNLDHKSG